MKTSLVIKLIIIIAVLAGLGYILYKDYYKTKDFVFEAKIKEVVVNDNVYTILVEEYDKKKKEYEIQKKANFPKIRFDTRYNLYGSDPNNFFRGVGDIQQRSFSFRISTSFVIFDGFKNINTLSKSRLEIEKLEIEKEKQITELKKKYEQIELDSRNALIQLENNARTLALVDKNLKMLEKLNVNGIVDKSSCIKKRLNLLDKKLDLEKNQIKIFVAQYKLLVLSIEEVGL